LAEKIIELLEDKNNLKKYKENAVKFAWEFDWNKIFANALSI